LLAEEGVNHAQIIVAEADLSWQHQETPDPKVHAQTVGAELQAISGEPDAIEEAAHAQTGAVGPGDPNANTPEGVAHAEPDSMSGEVITPNTVPGKPDTLEGVAHMQTVDVQPDSTQGGVADPKMHARTHLEGAEPETLMGGEDDQLLEVEGRMVPPGKSQCRGGHGSSCRTARTWGQLPCHAREHRITHLFMITTTQYPGGC